MTNRKLVTLAVAAALTLEVGGLAFAQSDCNALVDALVHKKILTPQEADNIKADIIKENAASSAGKLNLSDSITSIKLYGDVRLREQYDNLEPQVEPKQSFVPGSTATGNPQHGSQEDRLRFRLRAGADITLGEHWFGGFGLQSNVASDSGNQTFGPAFSNYGIYIDRAFMGWRNDWLMVEAGKFANPFYTTDLIWDPDINPDGFVQSIAFHKLFAGEETGYSKDGKTTITRTETPPWELTLNLGELAYDDNKEDAFGGYRWNTDAWMFVAQLIGSYKITPDVKVTLAPGYMTYTAGNVTNANDSVPFSNQTTSLVVPSTTGTVNSVLTGSAAGLTPTGKVNGVVTSSTAVTNNVATATSTTVYSTLLGHSAVGHLSIVTAPGDVSFKLCGVKIRALWDFAYNTEGEQRAVKELGLIGPIHDPKTKALLVSGHSSADDFAWLAGFAIGENKKQGDFAFFANYRHTGIASIDPNINDSDFALSYVNTQGYKVGIAYNITDFCVGAVTWYDAWNLRKNLVGGEATTNSKIANANQVQVLQVDLNVKF